MTASPVNLRIAFLTLQTMTSTDAPIARISTATAAIWAHNGCFFLSVHDSVMDFASIRCSPTIR